MNPIQSFFQWLRRRVCESVLSGVADAAECIEDPAAANGTALLLPPELRQRLAALALPAPAQDETARPKKSR